MLYIMDFNDKKAEAVSKDNINIKKCSYSSSIVIKQKKE